VLAFQILGRSKLALSAIFSGRHNMAESLALLALARIVSAEALLVADFVGAGEDFH
jgi:hypothetical protein